MKYKRRRRGGLPARIKERLSGFDPICAATALLMALYGILVIASAVRVSTPSPGKYIAIQGFAVLLGVVAMTVAACIDYEALLERFHIPLYLICVGILALTLVIGTGEGSNKSWIRFDFLPIGIQPSEFAKILFICTFAYHLSRVRERINRPLTLLGLCLHFGLVSGVVLLQGDLGSALVFVFIFIVMLFSAGISPLWMLGGAAVVTCAFPFLWERLSYYQRQRILVGFSPESDPKGFGYQVLRAKEAIANGGLFGMGYFSGTLSQSPAASSLPKRHTDMIFAVMAEEFGFLGVCVYLGLFVLLVLRLLSLSRGARDRMGGYLCAGAAAVFIFQGLENIGMCLGVLPVIGLTLPFMSYGGSSVLSLFLLVGVAESVAVHRGR